MANQVNSTPSLEHSTSRPGHEANGESTEQMLKAHYEWLVSLMNGRTDKKLGNNTWGYMAPGGLLEITLHKTVILRATPNGSLKLDSGGYKTVTTKDRLNEYLPAWYQIYQAGGVWHLVHFLTTYHYGGEMEDFVFADGMVINAGFAEVHGAADQGEVQRLELLGQRINAYAKQYAAAMVRGKVHPAIAGECVACLFPEQHQGQTRHLEEHIQDNLFVPAILKNAMEYKGNMLSPVAREFLHTVWYGEGHVPTQGELGYTGVIAEKQVAAVLKAYLRKELGLTS